MSKMKSTPKAKTKSTPKAKQSDKINVHLQKLKNLLTQETGDKIVESVNENSSPSQETTPPVEVVVFNDPRKRKKGKINTTRDEEKSSKVDTSVERKSTFDLFTARTEVANFGVSGFDKKKKEEVKIALAVKLGAKPPKNKYINYKKLMEEKRAEKMSTDDTTTDHYSLKKQKLKKKESKPDKTAIRKFDREFGRITKPINKKRR